MKKPVLILLALFLGISAVAFLRLQARRPEAQAPPVSSGRFLTPTGTHVGVGSFPNNMVQSPNGRFLVVTDSGFREQLTVIDTRTGARTDSLGFNEGGSGDKDGLYYGLAFGKEKSGPVLYASLGMAGSIARFSLSPGGKLTRLAGNFVIDPSLRTAPIAGIAYDPLLNRVSVAVNRATDTGDHHGDVLFFNAQTRDQVDMVTVPGYPLDLAYANGKTWVSCERDGVVVAIKDDVCSPPIKTGANPTHLTLRSDGKIMVANSGSDTVSTIDPESERVTRTTLVRPSAMRGLPVATPLGVVEYGTKLLVACGDLNAVAVLDRNSERLEGLVPTGWYPSALSVSGGNLFVSSAKGVRPRTPNGRPVGPSGDWGQYAPNIIEGTVSKINLRSAMTNLGRSTRQVLANDRLATGPRPFLNPGIKHVIYVIKENRTYDQVFGDITEGNGDPSLVMFGAEVTPNQHALAKRFTLLDNFYDCAEVSADGWNWSTSGMVNEYTARNVVNSYSGRRPGYDYEGENGKLAPDLEGLTDVASAPGGYLWDDAARHRVSFRNYGFFVRGMKAARAMPAQMEAVKRVLQSRTDASFPQFDMTFADSDLWQRLGKTAKNQKKAFGKFGEPSRIDEWKREFDDYVRAGGMPSLMFIRLPRDHTSGTSAGQWAPRAMVADNDYAVGQLVEAVSHSPFWKETVICVLEDDAQDGYDHVDCHRSTALVISPFMERSRHDNHFYNTDSMLRTIEAVLGLPPMNGFDATADPIGGFRRTALNDEPYRAIVPSSAIAGEINKTTAYRAADSLRLMTDTHEESAADLQLNDILWGAIKGFGPRPKIKGALARKHDDD